MLEPSTFLAKKTNNPPKKIPVPVQSSYFHVISKFQIRLITVVEIQCIVSWLFCDVVCIAGETIIYEFTTFITPEGLESFVCNICKKTYKYISTLKTHQKFECNMEPKFQCPVCPFKTKRKGNLNSHLSFKHRNTFDPIVHTSDSLEANTLSPN